MYQVQQHVMAVDAHVTHWCQEGFIPHVLVYRKLV